MNASTALRAAPEFDTGLWVFIGVASALFGLFVAAYLMRMGTPDWSSLALPPQLLLSTALLVAGSIALQRGALLAGGLCAFAFVAAQLWAWAALLDARVSPYANPAASFFFLLTAVHALHVLGGLAGWTLAWRRPTPDRIRLCARYWHFLLAAWLLVYATLAGVTPRVIAYICGVPA